MTAAILNLLPIPGLDGWAILEPYMDPKTQLGAAKIKPWGMIIVIVLLQFNSTNTRVLQVRRQGLQRRSAAAPLLRFYGYEFFKWWVKSPL